MTTRSADIAPPDAVDRLSALHPPLKAQWLAYRAEEGDEHRGDMFSGLAYELHRTGFRGNFLRTRAQPAERATEIEVLSFLGLPERGGRIGDNAKYVYPYWRSDTKSQWVVVVIFKGGLLEKIGWNDASVNDFSWMTRYRSWSDVLGAAH